MKILENIVLWDDEDVNIFNSPCNYLVRPSTCCGNIPSDGFNLEFPEFIKDYKIACNKGELKLGIPWIWKHPPMDAKRKNIIAFPVRFSRSDTINVKRLENMLKYFVKHHEDWKIKNVAFPLLARKGLGVHEDLVLALMTEYLQQIDIHVEIFT